MGSENGLSSEGLGRHSSAPITLCDQPFEVGTLVGHLRTVEVPLLEGALIVRPDPGEARTHPQARHLDVQPQPL